MRLTAAGEAALPYARAALAAVADIRTAIDELTELVRGTVTIGTVTSHNVDMPALLADFHADHPNVEITLGTDNSDALIEKVRTGRWIRRSSRSDPMNDLRASTSKSSPTRPSTRSCAAPTSWRSGRPSG